LLKNPPTIPTLALVWLVGWMRGSKVIIDWHNLGYSILALKLGHRHPFVRIATWYIVARYENYLVLNCRFRFEAWFGRNAYAHLFVTQAMRDFLVRQWDLQYAFDFTFSYT
jgi:beta-1,4-mannosyltransferase